MRATFLIFLVTVLLYQPCDSQTKAKITDVDFHIEDRYIVVNYNLTGTLPKEQMTIELRMVSEKNETIVPKVTGDIGTKVFTDGPKSILWDLYTDQIVFSGTLKAVVSITSSKILYSGASNAMLSIFIPGLGGYFVDKSKARAVLTTMSVAGLMGYGIIQKLKSDRYYEDYETSSNVGSNLETLYTQANDAHHKYLNFTRIAAGIWAFDVIYVLFKGAHNKKVAESAYKALSGDGLKLYQVSNGLQLGYSVSF